MKGDKGMYTPLPIYERANQFRFESTYAGDLFLKREYAEDMIFPDETIHTGVLICSDGEVNKLKDGTRLYRIVATGASKFSDWFFTAAAAWGSLERKAEREQYFLQTASLWN